MWVLPAGLRWMKVGADMVVFNPAANGFVELDRSGAELWTVLVATDGDEQALIDHLGESHGLAIDEAAPIVDGFIADLRRNGMINQPGA